MFGLEISFNDGVSQPEMIFIRRPQGVIGSSDNAHVVVDDLKSVNCQLRLVRDIGRRFRCKSIPLKEGENPTELVDGNYDGEAAIEIAGVRLYVTALDFDLLLKDAEPPDRAGVRVLRQSCSYDSPEYPAALVRGSPPMIVSFVPDQPIYIGRSKQCALRLDSPDISARHARMGYESGEFWIEDLGSTNGTFVNQQQISGRVNVAPGASIVLGREVTIVGVTAGDQLERAAQSIGDPARRIIAPERKYPILISISEVARPARVVLNPGSSVTIGREPGCDMWLGAPHISRKHCVVSMAKSGALTVQDSSTNGTAYDRGILKKGEVLTLAGEPQVLDFGAGVTVAVCFDAEHERTFASSGGSPYAFNPRNPGEVSAERVLELPPPNGSPRPRFGETRQENKPNWWTRVSDYFFSLKPPARIAAVMILALLSVLSAVLINLLYGMLS